MFEASETHRINQLRFNITTTATTAVVFFHFEVGQNTLKAGLSRLMNNSRDIWIAEVTVANFSQTVVCVINILFPNLKQWDQTTVTNTYKISMKMDECTPFAISQLFILSRCCCYRKTIIFFTKQVYIFFKKAFANKNFIVTTIFVLKIQNLA